MPIIPHPPLHWIARSRYLELDGLAAGYVRALGAGRRAARVITVVHRGGLSSNTFELIWRKPFIQALFETVSHLRKLAR